MYCTILGGLPFLLLIPTNSYVKKYLKDLENKYRNLYLCYLFENASDYSRTDGAGSAP